MRVYRRYEELLRSPEFRLPDAHSPILPTVPIENLIGKEGAGFKMIMTNVRSSGPRLLSGSLTRAPFAAV